MRGIRFIALLTAILPCQGALAKDISLPLSDKDQSNLRSVCVAAVKSPALNAETTEQIVTWCAWVKATIDHESAKPAAPAGDPRPDSDLVKRSQ